MMKEANLSPAHRWRWVYRVGVGTWPGPTLSYKKGRGGCSVPLSRCAAHPFYSPTFRTPGLVPLSSITLLTNQFVVMFFKTIILFLAMTASVNALVVGAIPQRREPLTFGPFTPEQWDQYSKAISHLQSTGAIKTKREPHFLPPLNHGLRARADIRLELTQQLSESKEYREQLERLNSILKSTQRGRKREPTPFQGFNDAVVSWVERQCGTAVTDECRSRAYASIQDRLAGRL